ncbi:bifunctional cytidylyltransferase/SDR family oxidoreductase [Nocardioides donggukensis]|uniref:2-C-methyl-D-erythritol 4-phosphate cytidylyltransferase n=1 Tax=Nocardioides donggukensis TaxID=2774019 RepID=A0A927KAR0_9ACTN|nr:bifunctional cytidylyltransferase/SDR family oxidoreductase [Nocardioides donggukensis]MBD8870866.1 bifunctional cytidylyltransferase/SDR family oxidoreductase [Nocardioides donggukensis]
MEPSTSRPIRNVAVLLAGGVGTRVGLDIPKQLIKVAGKTILEHSLQALHGHPQVDEVLIMMTPGHLDAVREIVKRGDYHKVVDILEGGDTRNATTLRALDRLGDDECHVLFHDAVRPLVTARIVSECFEALKTHPAVDVAIPSADTIVEVDEDDVIRAIPQRAALRRGQTPQCFRSSVIKQAYARAVEDPDFVSTDDCSVVLRYVPEAPIVVVHGDERNMKVTEPIDVYLADKLFQLTRNDLPVPADEAEYRAALAGRTVVVFGGSYGIGAGVAALAESLGADVFTFSRSSTGTHVERREDVAAAARSVIEKTGRVDYVVNTAGVLPRGTLMETSEETVYAATEINYLAPVFIAQEFFPHLREQRGSLLLFTSSSYTRGRSGYSLYSSAKAATVNLTQALADEWAADGVRVNCINPERTATPMRTKAFGQEPPGSLLDSETVSRTSLDVLISDQTGHIFDVRKDDPFATGTDSGTVG